MAENGLIYLAGDRRSAEHKGWTPWLGAASELVHRFHAELDDDPFAYNETASVSLLASAAAQVGYLGLAEFGVRKGHRKDRRVGADGRCDLWMDGKTTTWGFEFKQATLRRRLTEAAPRRVMQSAMNDARCLRSDEADQRVAGLIVSLYWLDDEFVKHAGKVLREFAKARDFAWLIPSPGDEAGDTFLFLILSDTASGAGGKRMGEAGKGAAPPAGHAKKTAVVVVHGMGEQRPMETLWGLVAALWTADPSIKVTTPGAPGVKEVWSKPEGLTGSYELRRVTTDFASLDSGHDKRVDFFEFYWAHLMTGNTVKSVWTWLFGVLFRRPSTVPKPLFKYWLIGVASFSAGAILLGLAPLSKADPALAKDPNLHYLFLAASAFSFLISILGTSWLAPVAGDAARYLSATPDNVDARQKIREAGVNLLSQLHLSGHYDRIVILAHSLGSVVAYDVINATFGRLTEDQLKASHADRSAALSELAALERLAGTLVEKPTPQNRRAYREGQRAYQAALRAARTPLDWLVSDFVTVGSPLSKANVLIAKDPAQLELKKARREAPSCPPWLETRDPVTATYRFSYPLKAEIRIPHHAAAFASVVWTNIYFLTGRDVISGDIIAGPCAGQLGPGILDIALPLEGLGFKHLDYWKKPEASPPAPAIINLRKAVNLALLDETTLWDTEPKVSSAEPHP